MTSVQLVLASASAGRLARLRAAGVEPEVIVSGVAEDDVSGCASEVASMLANRKARAVAAVVRRRSDVAGGGVRVGPERGGPRTLVLGCDSVLEQDGAAHGKPTDAADAVERWRGMRGQVGTLFTGHCLIDPLTGQEESDVGLTVVRFGRPSDAEITAYVASGEPGRVAGAFTVDGLGGWFLDGIDGDPSNVIGVSLPLLRGLFQRFGVAIADLWAT